MISTAFLAGFGLAFFFAAALRAVGVFFAAAVLLVLPALPASGLAPTGFAAHGERIATTVERSAAGEFVPGVRMGRGLAPRAKWLYLDVASEAVSYSRPEV